jgi:hypothetical protein
MFLTFLTYGFNGLLAIELRGRSGRLAFLANRNTASDSNPNGSGLAVSPPSMRPRKLAFILWVRLDTDSDVSCRKGPLPSLRYATKRVPPRRHRMKLVKD